MPPTNAPADPDELIALYHPDTKGVFATTRRAYDLTWSKRKWREVTSSDSKDVLTAAIESLGRDVPVDASAKQLADLVAPVPAPEPEPSDPNLAP